MQSGTRWKKTQSMCSFPIFGQQTEKQVTTIFYFLINERRSSDWILIQTECWEDGRKKRWHNVSHTQCGECLLTVASSDRWPFQWYYNRQRPQPLAIVWTHMEKRPHPSRLEVPLQPVCSFCPQCHKGDTAIRTTAFQESLNQALEWLVHQRQCFSTRPHQCDRRQSSHWDRQTLTVSQKERQTRLRADK